MGPSPVTPPPRPPSQARRLVGVGEAAAMLNMSVCSLRRLIWAGRLPAVRLTRRVQVDLRDLDRLIEASKDGSAR